MRLLSTLLLVALGLGGVACKKQKPAIEWIDDREPVERRGVAPLTPAPHDPAPQIITAGGPVLQKPRIVPIFFQNDDMVLVEKVTEFLSTLGGSAYWTATTSEYGVGPATMLPRVIVQETREGVVSGQSIETWLQEQLESTNRLLPKADPNNIYLIHFPKNATIVTGDSASCSSYGGYHSEVSVATAHPEISVAYAVIARCSTNDDLDDVGRIDTHELVEAATDPYVNHRRAYLTVGPNDLVWSLVNSGGEVGDMCQVEWNASVQLSDMAYVVQRSWSNKAAAEGRDPCQPPLPGSVYFNSALEQRDTVTLRFGGQPFSTKGILVPPSGTRTVNINLFSEAETAGPWNVDVREVFEIVDGRPSLELSLDRHEGQNGDVLKLTIKVLRTNELHGAPIVVRSTRGPESHAWIGHVSY